MTAAVSLLPFSPLFFRVACILLAHWMLHRSQGSKCFFFKYVSIGLVCSPVSPSTVDIIDLRVYLYVSLFLWEMFLVALR